jgi:hypothetical protein
MMSEQRIQALIDSLTADEATPDIVAERWERLNALNRESAARIRQLAAAYPLSSADLDAHGNPTAQGLKKIARAVRPLLSAVERQFVVDVEIGRRQEREG